MSIYLAIALGGAFGAVSRYWMSTSANQWLGPGFPYGTLTVNLLGSLVMGFLSILLIQRIDIGEAARLGLLVGFLGSFTTFSAFAIDTLKLAGQGELFKAASYVLLSVVFCIVGAWAGLKTANQMI